MELDLFKTALDLVKTDSIRLRGAQLVKRLITITNQYADPEDEYVKKTLEQARQFLVDYEHDRH